MNYYQARKRVDDGRWVFSVRNDGQIWATGHCLVKCDGHETREEAERHWYEYELDTARYDVKFSHQQRECAICNAWTSMAAQLGPGLMESIVLCDEHRNRAGLEQARPFHAGIAITSSY